MASANGGKDVVFPLLQTGSTPKIDQTQVPQLLRLLSSDTGVRRLVVQTPDHRTFPVVGYRFSPSGQQRRRHNRGSQQTLDARAKRPPTLNTRQPIPLIVSLRRHQLLRLSGSRARRRLRPQIWKVWLIV